MRLFLSVWYNKTKMQSARGGPGVLIMQDKPLEKFTLARDPEISLLARCVLALEADNQLGSC